MRALDHLALVSSNISTWYGSQKNPSIIVQAQLSRRMWVQLIIAELADGVKGRDGPITWSIGRSAPISIAHGMKKENKLVVFMWNNSIFY